MTYFNSVKRRAESKDRDFSIKIEDIWELFIKQDRKCALSGLPIAFLDEGTASLDRVDSSLGYTPENVQWVHKDVNRMKMAFSDTAFIWMCALIVNHNLNIFT
jgi:hypothetical protein